MFHVALHHVSVPTRDLATSCAFYEGVLGLKKVRRPPFSSSGEWYAVGPLQIHIIVYADANFRLDRGVDNDDIHFALQTDDFDAAVGHLRTLGYSEERANDDIKRLIVKYTGAAGFPQVFLMDPDRNVIEINNAPFNP